MLLGSDFNFINSIFHIRKIHYGADIKKIIITTFFQLLKLASNTPGTLKRFLGAVISNWFQLEFLADDRYVSYP